MQFVISELNKLEILRLPKDLVLNSDGGQGVAREEVLVKITRLLFAMVYAI